MCSRWPIRKVMNWHLPWRLLALIGRKCLKLGGVFLYCCSVDVVLLVDVLILSAVFSDSLLLFFFVFDNSSVRL